jgi:hypothetical protein
VQVARTPRDWQSLLFDAVHAPDALAYRTPESLDLPDGERHTWKVFSRWREPDDAPIGVAAMVLGEDGWSGPFLVEWPVLDGLRAGWAEVMRGVLESAFDATDWTVPTTLETAADAVGPDGQPFGGALERLGMRLVRLVDGRATWRLDPTDPEQVYHPPTPDRGLGIAFSGGGLRAAGFGLGALWTLVDHGVADAVRVVTSVSGGSILSGAWLAARHRGEPDREFLGTMRRFLHGDVIGRASRDGRRPPATLLARYADLLAGGLLAADGRALRLGEVRDGGIEAIFQITELSRGGSFALGTLRDGRSLGPMWGSPDGLRLSRSDVGPIRLADAVVASAAFPVGFLPVSFPADFDLPEDAAARLERVVQAQRRAGAWSPLPSSSGRLPPPVVPLVDGGVFDNQGIAAMLLAIRRKSSRLAQVLIVDADKSDVRDEVLRLRPRALGPVASAVYAAGAVALAATILARPDVRQVALQGLVGVGGLAAALAAWVAVGALPRGIGVVRFVLPDRLALAVLGRAELATSLLSDVFMRRVRHMWYGALYERIYDRGLPSHVSLSASHVRSIEAHWREGERAAGRDDDLRTLHQSADVALDPQSSRRTRGAAFALELPVSVATLDVTRRVAALPTVLRFGHLRRRRHARTRDAVVAGRACALLALLRTVHVEPRPRTPAARAWAEAMRSTWEREFAPGGKLPEPEGQQGP